MTIIDKIVDGFPHPTIPPIVGIPTYEAIAELNLHLNANAASVQSNLGNGQLGLLALTVSPAIFNTLSTVAFVPPANPGTTPTIPGGSTGAQTQAVIRQHTTDDKIFQEYLACDNALKQQIISCVNSMYLRTLSHRITGFANVTTRQMLTHLYTTYGRLTPSDLQANDARMKTNYDPNQPIEAFLDQIGDAVALADAAQAPYMPAQIVAIAYNLIFSTGMFPDACRDWRRRPTVEQTWANFKTDMALAHQELRDSQVTSTQAGYQSANAAYADAYDIHQETAQAIANLATATASDRSTVASLTATNSSLNDELLQSNAKLTAASKEITALKIELAILKAAKPSATPGNSHRPRTYTPNNNYCWTHGYKVNRSHTSSTCSQPQEGHKTAATRENNMGGSQRGKE
jgi:hypothetical protein